MAFRDLDEFLHEPEPIVLPIHGKDYSFPAVISGELWVKVQKVGGRLTVGDPTAVAVSDAEEDELLQELCGDTLQEMYDDHITSVELQIVLTTLIAYHLSNDRDVAEAIWNAQGEAPAPNRAERRRKTPPTSTPSRGSRGGSTPPKRKKPASAGRKSLNTGSASKPT
jgi:hypothetical protein